MTDDSITPKPEPPTSLPSGLTGPRELLSESDPPADPDEAAEIAVRDLSARIEVSVDQVDVVLAAEHTWSDGSVGCPEPGRMYTQALTPGFRVVLAVDGTEYAYHGAMGQPLFFCPNPAPESSLDQ